MSPRVVEASRAEWRRYISAVYGATAPRHGAEVAHGLEMLYVAPLGVRVTERCARDDASLFRPFNIHAPAAGVGWRRRSRLLGGRGFDAVVSHEWVEVTHCSGSAFEEAGVWHYAVKGSGVYVSVGRTIAFSTHEDAARHFLGRGCEERCRDDPVCLMQPMQCDAEIPRFIAEAARRGFDSIQFVNHCDAGECATGRGVPAERIAACSRCRAGSVLAANRCDAECGPPGHPWMACGHEIVLTQFRGTGVCPDGLRYRGGFNASEACACVPLTSIRSLRGACVSCVGMAQRLGLLRGT
jgi:hypothetical protein